MIKTTIIINTSREKEIVNIDQEIRNIIAEQGWSDGLLLVYTPHTTTALTINENADPDVPLDILQHLQQLVPRLADFAHSEGNSDAHILSSLLGNSVQLIIEGGNLVLGTWQSVFLAEFDGPRQRNIFLKFVES